MNMEILVLRSIEAFLLPPGLMLLLLALGAVLMSRFYLLGKMLVLSGFVLLLAASLPGVAQLSMNLLESAPHLTEKAINANKAQAIIVPGGGRHADQPEYNSDTVSTATLERLRYAAHLHKKTKLPILVTGGSVYGEQISEAELMRKTLEQELGAKVRWVERKSRNTWENASYSNELLSKDKIEQAYLVTHAWHMTRAYQAFANSNLNITPAPMGYSTTIQTRPALLNWLPDSKALHLHKIFFREMLGQLWYKVRY